MSLKYQVHYSESPCRLFHRRHGQFHRLDGPAILYKIGNIYYRQYDDYHRGDGPAVYQHIGPKETWPNLYQAYYIRGESVPFWYHYYLRIRRHVINIRS